ncbi:MAG TPA: hypothetical protein VEV43_08990 [Actinomycetota bacterium]|nr:hypothetical protein [Actinomycetota bacterium]
MRKLVLTVMAASAIVTSGGVASAEEITIPPIGREGCEVSGGTVGVLEPDGAVTYDNFYVDPYFCLPPP